MAHWPSHGPLALKPMAHWPPAAALKSTADVPPRVAASPRLSTCCRYRYNQGNVPPSLTSYVSKLTHINYAFSTVSYSPQYDSYYLDFTDTWADIGACLTGSCPTVRGPAGAGCWGGGARAPLIAPTLTDRPPSASAASWSSR